MTTATVNGPRASQIRATIDRLTAENEERGSRLAKARAQLTSLSANNDPRTAEHRQTVAALASEFEQATIDIAAHRERHAVAERAETDEAFAHDQARYRDLANETGQSLKRYDGAAQIIRDELGALSRMAQEGGEILERWRKAGRDAELTAGVQRQPGQTTCGVRIQETAGKLPRLDSQPTGY